MKRIVKVVAACVGAAGVLAFLFLVPIIPTTVTTYDLYSQHGLCIGTEIDPAPTLVIYGSASYMLSHYGVVYVPTAVISGGSHSQGKHQTSPASSESPNKWRADVQ